jgi:hypothetical protein
MARWPRRTTLLVTAAALVLPAGCSSPTADTTGCTDVRDDVVTAISARLEQSGELRYAQQVIRQGDDTRFISAELHEPGDDEDEDGVILTWATTGPDRPFVAVDERARENSSWPSAALDVRDDGAIESRACAADERADDDDEHTDCPAGASQQLCDRSR